MRGTGSLVKIEEAVGNLLEAGGNLVGVLGAHGGKRSQDDEIERALEQLDRVFIFTWHPSDTPAFKGAPGVLVCQVISTRALRCTLRAVCASGRRGRVPGAGYASSARNGKGKRDRDRGPLFNAPVQVNLPAMIFNNLFRDRKA